jgi:hypothetical protein
MVQSHHYDMTVVWGVFKMVLVCKGWEPMSEGTSKSVPSMGSWVNAGSSEGWSIVIFCLQLRN